MVEQHKRYFGKLCGGQALQFAKKIVFEAENKRRRDEAQRRVGGKELQDKEIKNKKVYDRKMVHLLSCLQYTMFQYRNTIAILGMMWYKELQIYDL